MNVNESNLVEHVNRIYDYVKVLSDNHNKLIGHIKDIHQNVKSLHDDVMLLKSSVQNRQSSRDFDLREARQ